MLLNAKNQMLASNNNIIRKLDSKLISLSAGDEENFWSCMDFQREIIDLYKKQIRKISKK